MSNLLDKLTSLPAGLVYLLVGLLVFAEDALFIGFLLPGETAAILGGVAASLAHASLTAILAIVVIAAILGDTIGYQIGKHYGTRLLKARPLARRRRRVDQARTFLARRGGPAVFLGRFVAFLRATMPFLAGTAHMRYRTFLAYNAAGGIVWGVAVVLLGYFAGSSYKRIEHIFGQAAAITVAVAAIISLIIWQIRRHRRDLSS
jgi:membrane protein DedA with SNARE-associated domain